MKRILHIAPMNYAGVPYSFYRMHLQCGDISRIITLHRNPHDFPEDICLGLPIPSFGLAKLWRKRKVSAQHSAVLSEAPVFKPGNVFEKIYFSISDLSRKGIVDRTISELKLDEFDIIHYDAGLDFFRNSSQAIKWKKLGKKIVCCYYGSDLRSRGIIRQLNEISDLNITSEFDHLSLKKDINYLFYPYDISELPSGNDNPEEEFLNNDNIKIVHSPTNRTYKGTELILSVIEKIKKEKKIQFFLLENMPRQKVLHIKRYCDICIDQVGGVMGGTGYGKAGLETLGMGIPTITNMTKEYAEWLPENPFTLANDFKELYDRLNELIESGDMRNEKGRAGKNWVVKYHGYENVNRQLYSLYEKHGIV